jgi:hypothetical protein
MKYIIGTGYHPHPTARWFFDLWLENTLRFADPKPESVVVLADSGAVIESRDVKWISMNGDIGHVHDLIYGRKPYEYCGWSISICTLALLAYFNECDFVFKEQDVLAFGPWVKKMYSQITNGKLILGRAKIFPAVQSLFLVKHEFIPEFVRLYLGTGDERIQENLGEFKFDLLANRYPEKFRRYSFGYDRDRPFNVADEVFYVQKLVSSEVNLLRDAGLVSSNTRPPTTLGPFTGNSPRGNDSKKAVAQ